MLLIVSLIVFFMLSCLISPFACWNTYFKLWKYVLFDREKAIHVRVRMRQAGFLLKYILLCPFQTILWYLDELLFPAYNHQAVHPVFIIGLHRSGTTFLHRTMVSDEDTFAAVRHYEWICPYITVYKLLRFLGLEDRFKGVNFWPDTEAGRIATKMHESTLFDWEDDNTFFNEYLHHFYSCHQFPYPELIPYLTDLSVLPVKIRRRMLNNHQKVLKKVLYSRGTDKIYLSKQTCNDRLEDFQKLYPDAKFIIILRPLKDIISSLMAINKVTAMSLAGIDIAEIPGCENAFSNILRSDSLRLIRQLQQGIDPNRQLHISYDQFTKNVAPTIRLIYEWLGLKMSDDYLEYIEQVQQSQKKRQRGYEYEHLEFEGFEQYDAFVSQVDKSHKNALDDRS